MIPSAFCSCVDLDFSELTKRHSASGCGTEILGEWILEKLHVKINPWEWLMKGKSSKEKWVCKGVALQKTRL